MGKQALNKVAKITILFWIMKILATTLGETLGDLLSMTLNLGYIYGLLITTFVFLIVLFFQLKSSKFHSFLYWSVIVGTTTVGTEVSDFMDRTLGLGYVIGSSILLLGLLSIFSIWYYREKELAIYPIIKFRIEMFYWVAILFSNSLGTAFGDFLSDNLELGYINGSLVTASIILVVIILHYATKINQALLFWIAFIFTRPFGATFGDFLTKPVQKGGLNIGTIPSSIVTFFILFILLIWSELKEKTENKLPI